MVRAFLTSAFKADKEVEIADESDGYYCILHPVLKQYVWIPADQIIFKDDDVGDLL